MSLTGIMLTGTSGLITSQTQLRVTSDNIANINTPGYARKIANQESVVVGGVGMGSQVTSITRVADGFLQRASLSASSASGQAGVLAEFLDNAQALFGDPSSSTSFFAGLDDIYSAFSSASESPNSTLARGNAIASVQDFLSRANDLSNSLKSLADETDKRITDDVSKVNDILKQINQTNTDIARATVSGGDASGSQNIQSKLLDQLSSLMQIQISTSATGGTNVRSSDGVLLVGDGGASTLSYSKTNGVGVLKATPPHGQTQTIIAGGGEVDGLMQLGQTELPQMSEALSEFVSQAVDQLNAAHNANSSIPAPSSLTGRNTGIDLATAVGGFTGKTNVNIVDATGVVQKTVSIDFDAGTMSDGTTTTGFTPSTFLSTLNTALGGAATASFANGALSLSAAGGNGVVIADDATNPSLKAGRGFSAFFGMNDLISSTTFANYDTGLTTSDPNSFVAGGQMGLQLTDASGNVVKSVSVTVPSGGSIGDVINAMNANIGLYGAFGLDANGRMTFAASNNQAFNVVVSSDNTQSGATGPSISTLFGIGSKAMDGRTSSFSVRADIAANSANLALGKFDSTAAAGAPALGAGDGSGALALSLAGSTVTSFGAAGGMGKVQMSVLDYASEIGGLIGNKASSADSRKTSADAVASEATTRRSSVEGVNLDEELVNLTTFQQAYNASTRLIQAAKDMYDTLLNMMN